LKPLIDYWNYTRHPRTCIYFVAPLWLLYEALAFRLNQGLGGDYRTGVDYLIKALFERLNLPLGLTILVPLIFVCWLLFAKAELWRMDVVARPVYSVGFIFESILYAVMLGLVVSGFVKLFLTVTPLVFKQEQINTLVIHLGSGVFEEVLFRLVLMTLAVIILQQGLKWPRNVAVLVAVVISSLVFSLFHFLNVFQEPFQLDALLFRFFAGVAFSVIYLFRGLGVAVYTHSFYNIFLMFRQ